MINVELGSSFLGYPEATYELPVEGPRTVINVQGYEEDTYESVARSMCRALALLGFRGEVELFYDGMGDEEDKQEILDTIRTLGGKLQITDEDAVRVAEEELQQAEDVLAGFKKTASFIREEGLRRGLTKEERQKLTLAEALEEPKPEK